MGFNPQLCINDSLLVQSYVTAYDISYPEALRRVEGEVEELQDILRTEGRYTMDDIGTLTVNSEGNYQFEPCEAGVLSPELYGLGGVSFRRLKESKEPHRPVVADSPAKPHATESENEMPALIEFTETEDDKDRAIEIKMSWIRNAVAVAAAVIAFFLMATPIANSDLNTQTMSNLQSGLLKKLMPKDTNVMSATPAPVAIAQAEPAKDSLVAEAKPEIAKADTLTGGQTPCETETAQEVCIPVSAAYCIVLASQVKMSNAEHYVEDLHQRGYSEAEVYVHNNIVRVVYGSYETEGEAYRQLNRLSKREEFAEAWVYKKKKSA